MLEKKDVVTLVKLGLTINQAKTYLADLKAISHTVKEISQISKISIQDTYRVMTSLQELGLVEKQISSPTLFYARPIKPTIDMLLNRKDLELRNLHHLSFELENKQEYNPPFPVKKENYESKFLVISGKTAIFAKSNQVIENANRSACVSTLWESGSKGTVIFAELLNKALKRGVKFRFIINLPLDQKDNYLKKIVKDHINNPLYEVRFVERNSVKKHLIFSIFDDTDVLFSVKESSLGDSPLLWSNNKQFIELFQDAFEFIWSRAIKD